MLPMYFYNLKHTAYSSMNLNIRRVHDIFILILGETGIGLWRFIE